MVTTEAETIGQWAMHRDTSKKVAGTWLAIGSVLLVVSFVFHPPPSPNTSEQMAIVADGATRWMAVHWAAAVALSLFAVAGLVVLSSRSRLTQDWPTMTAWAVLIVGSLWTVMTAVAEATAITDAAVAGNVARFEAWSAFAEGMTRGFAFVALAIAVIASYEARATDGVTPAWAAWIAVVAAVASFVGMVLGLWLGIALGGVLWVASSIVMSLWTLWFGVALMRPESDVRVRSGDVPA